MLPLTFDRYRTVAWNVGIVLTQVQLADQLDHQDDLPRTNAVLKTMVSAYLDLLAHEFPAIQPNLPIDTLNAQPLEIGDLSLFREAKPTSGLIAQCKAAIVAGRKPVIVTLQSEVIPAQRFASDARIGSKMSIASAEEFVTGLVLKDALMQGLAWRSCVVKFLGAYNYLVASSLSGDDLMIEGRK